MTHHDDTPTVERTGKCAGQIVCLLLLERTFSGWAEVFLLRTRIFLPSVLTCEIPSVMRIKSAPLTGRPVLPAVQ
jgi:hypothetical protein